MGAIDRFEIAGRASSGSSVTQQGRIGKALLEARRHGLPRTLYDLTLKAVNTAVVLKILRGVWIERPDPAFLECHERYTPLFLPEKMVRDFATGSWTAERSPPMAGTPPGRRASTRRTCSCVSEASTSTCTTGSRTRATAGSGCTPSA